jgi:hypothetical protein
MSEAPRSSPVTRAGEWGAAVAGSLVIGPLGYFAAQWLEAGFGVSLGVGVLLAAGAFGGAYLSFRAPCPGCGRELRFSNVAVEDGEGRTVRSVRDGYVLCLGCHRYAEHREDRLVEVEPERIAPRPVFEVRGTDLGPYSPEAPSPEVCCACGQPAVGVEVCPLLVSSEEVAMGAMVRVQKAQVELGHCAAHEDAARGDGSVIWLRSYPVWRAITRS